MERADDGRGHKLTIRVDLERRGESVDAKAEPQSPSEPAREHEHERVNDEHEQTKRGEGQRKSQPEYDRPNNRIHHAEDHGHDAKSHPIPPPITTVTSPDTNSPHSPPPT